jgi:hypothetical protein
MTRSGTFSHFCFFIIIIYLKTTASLRCLTLFHNGIDTEGFAALIGAGVARRALHGRAAQPRRRAFMPQLQLFVGSNRIGRMAPFFAGTEDGRRRAAFVAGLAALEVLSIESNGLGVEGAALLAEAVSMPGSVLETADISWNGIGDAGARSIADALGSLAALQEEDNTRCALRTLRVANNRLSPATCAALLGACAAAHVSNVLLSHNSVGGPTAEDADRQALADALRRDLRRPPGSLTGITRLVLSHASVDLATALRLAEVIPHSPIEALTVTDMEIRAEGSRALVAAAIAPGASVRELILANDHSVGSAGITDIARILSSAMATPKPRALRVLHLNRLAAENTDGTALAQIIAAPHMAIEVILFRSNMMTNASVAPIADALVRNTRLRLLDLRNNLLTLRAASAPLAAACSDSQPVPLAFTPEQRLAIALAMHRRRLPADVARLVAERCPAQGVRQLRGFEISTVAPQRLRAWRDIPLAETRGDSPAGDGPVSSSEGKKPAGRARGCAVM